MAGERYPEQGDLSRKELGSTLESILAKHGETDLRDVRDDPNSMKGRFKSISLYLFGQCREGLGDDPVARVGRMNLELPGVFSVNQ